MSAEPGVSDTPASALRGLRILLLSIAVIETIGALQAAPILFGDLSEVTGPGPGGWIVTLALVLRPVFAIAALVLALRRALRVAIMALSAVVLVNWFSMFPSVVLHGLDFESSGSLYASAHFLLAPVLALAALALAGRNEQLGLAGIMVSIPTLADMAGLVAFAIGVMIYGF